MANYPVTHGYTINIGKDRSRPAVILLNQSQTLYLAVPEKSINPGQLDPATKTDSFLPLQENEANKSSEVYFEPVNSVNFEDNPVGFFTEVAHEEVVVEDEVPHEREVSLAVSASSNLPVHCDLCNSKLSSTDEAKLHMKNVHDVISYEGPFFKCDFCGQLVTDRVTHMKQAHYSPLNGAFTKASGGYQCRECDYVSDQLTNIRNHVDAKHNDGANKYVCEECKSEYKTLNSMRAHKSRVHVKKRKIQGIGMKTVDRNQKQKLEKEILELELKTLPSIVSRAQETNKYYLV